MSTDSFLAMLGKETVPIPIEPVKDNSIIHAYNLLYDKEEHKGNILNAYNYIIERPPNQIDAVDVAFRYLNSLTSKELDIVLKKLGKQIKTEEKKYNILSEYKKLDEMAQYKFFCSVRDMYDDEDWNTLTDKE